MQKQKGEGGIAEKSQLSDFLSFGFIFIAGETQSFLFFVPSVAFKTSWTPIDFSCLINEACN